MLVLRGIECATRSAIQVAPLTVGELLLAGLESDVVVSTDQTFSGFGAPLSVRAGLREGVAHRGQLIGHRARGRVIGLGAGELVLRDLDELRRDGAARGRGIAATASAGDEQHEERDPDHPTVFGSAVVRVKDV